MFETDYFKNSDLENKDEIKNIENCNSVMQKKINYNLYKFYNKNIQLSKDVIIDILNNCQNKKLLVFGLGYDSELWYNATQFNTYFIEHNINYIKLNPNINSNNIIHYNYNNISVKKSIQSLKSNNIQEFLDKYSLPDKLKNISPFDIILVDGPTGYDNNCPGRMLPLYWCKKYLTHKNTVVYVDDCNRTLEKKCINYFFFNHKKYYFSERNGCMKIEI